MGGLKSCMMVFMMMMMMMMHTSMAQTRHVVGGDLGWTIPPNGAAAYTTWAAGQNFTVGDTLFFNFTTGVHNVAQVSQSAYGPCTTANPISLTATGPATVTLTTAGPHYYICTVGAHCSIGQKLNITVAAAATPPPAASPTTPPPAATPTTPPPAATPTASPPAATPTPTPAPTPAATPTSSPAPAPVDQASPPSPPTPGPSPSGSTTSPPPGATETPTGSTTPAPPNNAGASFTAVVPATFLAIGLALFY